MAEYATVRNADDAIIKTEERTFSAEEQGTLARKFGTSKKYRILPVVDLADPTYVADTHRLGPRELNVETNRVTRQRSAVAMTAEEIAAKTERDADETERANLRQIIKTFRDGDATARQTQRAIAYLLKQLT